MNADKREAVRASIFPKSTGIDLRAPGYSFLYNAHFFARRSDVLGYPRSRFTSDKEYLWPQVAYPSNLGTEDLRPFVFRTPNKCFVELGMDLRDFNTQGESEATRVYLKSSAQSGKWITREMRFPARRLFAPLNAFFLSLSLLSLRRSLPFRNQCTAITGRCTRRASSPLSHDIQKAITRNESRFQRATSARGGREGGGAGERQRTLGRWTKLSTRSTGRECNIP